MSKDRSVEELTARVAALEGKFEGLVKALVPFAMDNDAVIEGLIEATAQGFDRIAIYLGSPPEGSGPGRPGPVLVPFHRPPAVDPGAPGAA